MNMAPNLPLLTDAVVAHALGAVLSVILLLGAWAKLRDLALFRASIEGYRLLPESMVAPAAIALALSELACGLAVLVAPESAGAALATTALLAVVTGAVAINLMRGRRDVDCGCAGLSGAGGGQHISWALVARNAVLLAALWLAHGGAATRDLVWVDYLSVAGSTLALLGLYVAANQLISNHPRLMAIKRT